ncbi:MAG: LytTR family DNA-binding domain-containing protein [Bacteroidota bacterium]
MSDQQFGFIKTDKKFIKLHYNDIILIKGLGNYVEIMTESGKKYTYYKSLKELIESLPNEFMRVHNSFIVNITHINSLEDNHLILPNTKVSVGKSYRTCLAEALSKRML